MIKPKKKSVGKQYAVLGLGRFGTEIVKELSNNGCEVLAVDYVKEKTLDVADFATHVIVADASDEQVLRSLAIDSFDVVVIAMGASMQSSIVCALCCKEMGAKFILAKANNDKHAKILEKIGVDKIIIPEAESANRAAALLMNPSVTEIVELEDGYTIVEVGLPENWRSRRLMELRVRNTYNINVLLVVHQDKNIETPSGETMFCDGDKIVVGGLMKDIDKFMAKTI